MSAQPSIRPCPVCGSLEGQGLARLEFAVFDDETLPARLELAACRDCGHSFYDGPLDQALVDEHYRRNRYLAASLTPGAGGDSEPDRRHQQQIIERLRPYLAPDFDQPVYDVGCGRGGLLKALAEAGFQRAMGLELLPEAVALIRSRGLRALEGSALSLPASGPAPGLVIYSHVFEHLAAPAEALAEARGRLAPGGLVYIEVPDASRYEADIPWRVLYQEHLSHFAPADLETLLHRAGFEILALERGRFPLAGGRSEGVVWALARPGPEWGSLPPSGNLNLSQEDLRFNAPPNKDMAGVVRPGTGPYRRQSSERALPCPLRHDRGQAAEALRAYLQACREHPLAARLAALADSGRPLKVWGLSQMTLLLLGSSPLGRADLRGFIDSDPSKRNRRLWGRAVEGPETLAGDSSGADVLLAAWGREDEMLNTLQNLGFRGRVHRLSGGDEI